MSLLHIFCYSCLWVKLPFILKLLLGVGIIAGGLLGGWLLGAGMGLGVLGSSLIAGLSGYEAMDKFFDWDTLFTDLAEYSVTTDPSKGFDTLEDTMNVVSPMPAVIEDTLGVKYPGADGKGALDQTADNILHSLRRIEELDLEY